MNEKITHLLKFNHKNELMKTSFLIPPIQQFAHLHTLPSFVLCVLMLGSLVFPHQSFGATGDMTEERAYELSEEFGVDVGEVDEEIKEFLGLMKAEGVVIFAVIGSTPADLAGIRTKAIIKEVDGIEVRNLLDLGRALERALPTQNFSVATYEPAGVDDQGIGGGLNFHMVRVLKD
jgi:membrane-associated protease RseP (regulator of RpoE activity)